MKNDKHALLSPSSAERWLNCPASPVLSQTVPSQTSEQAKEGTLAHAFVERLLRIELREYSTATEKKKLLDTVYADIKDKDMVQHCTDYVQFVLKLRQQILDKKQARFFEQVESRVTYTKELYGTADYSLICEDIALIVDFKYGERTPVDAETSSQLKTYALCLCKEYESVKTVFVAIFQPRSVYGDTKTKQKYTREELEQFDKKHVNPAVRRTLKILKDGVDLEHAIEGDWCQWCPAVIVCPRKLKVRDEMLEQFPEVQGKVLDTIGMDRLLEVYEKLPTLQTMVKSLEFLEEYFKQQLLNGVDVPGYKLITSVGRRSWKKDIDMTEAKKFFKTHGVKNAVKESLIGMGEIEKSLKAALKENPALLDNYIEKPVPKPALAKISDKRADWTESLVGAFTDETETIDLN